MRIRSLLLLGSAALLSGCMNDPMDRPGTWRATGANDANLRAMVADQGDLTRGKESTGSVGALAARPIERLQTGNRAQLQRVTASQVGLLGLTASPGATGGANAPR